MNAIMVNSLQEVGIRLSVWLLAALSFACLLGEMYGLWSMHWFACAALIPATAILAVIAYANRKRPEGTANPRSWIVAGAIGGVVAALAYDLFRLPFVIVGYPLFAVFPRFGQLLLAAPADDFGPWVQVTGWAYHFSNGAALGIMFLAMVPRHSRLALILGGIAWAAVVEALLLLTPYYVFFKLKLPFATFLTLTLSAHLVFGAVLGWWCWWRSPARRAA